MNKFIVAVRDRKLEAFNHPFTVPTLGFAERSFGDEVKNPESPVSQHPEDFDLYHIGYFDEDNGRLIPLEGLPTLVVQASALVPKAS